MSESFDPYHVWLSIPKADQPPNHYRLLGLPLLEDDPQVIENAADRQMTHIRSTAGGKHADLSQKLLGEISASRVFLLDREKKAAYDKRIKSKLAGKKPPPKQAQPLMVAEPLPDSGATGSKVLKTRASDLQESAVHKRQPTQVPAASQASPAKPPRPLLLQPVVLVAGAVFVLLAIGAVVMFGPGSGKEDLAQGEGGNPAAQPVAPSTSAAEPKVTSEVSPSEPTTPVKKSPPVSGEPEAEQPSETENPVVEKPGTEKPPVVEKPPEEKPTPPVTPDDTSEKKAPPETTTPESSPHSETPPATVVEETKSPIPPKSKRDASEQRVKELLADDFRSARTTEEKLVLGEKLFGLARDTKEENTTDRFVVFNEARLVAIDAGNATLALAAVEELEKQFELDGWALKQKTISETMPKARTAPLRKEIVLLTMRLADQAQFDDLYDVALELAQLALTTASRLRDVEMRKQSSARVRQLKELQGLWEAGLAAMKKLTEQPDDSEAHLTLGQYLCFVKGDWEQGLEHFTKSGDIDLAQLAKQDLASPTEPEEQVKLADQWQAWIEAGRRDERDAYRPLAHYWYSHALAELSGLPKAHVEKQLAQLGEVNQPRGAKVGKETPVAVTDAREAEGDKFPALVQLRKFGGEQCPDVGFIQGGRFGVGCRNRVVYIWDLATGKQVQAMSGPTPYLKIMTVSPNGRRVVCGFRRGEGAVIFDTTSGQVLRHFTGHTSDEFKIGSVDISADSTKAITSGRDGTIRIWELETAKELLKLDQGGLVRFLPDGRFLSANNDAVHIWNAQTGKEEQTLGEHTSKIHTVAVSPDGSVIAVGLAAEEIWLWQLQPQRVWRRILTPQTSGLNFSHDGRLLISCGGGKLALWNLATGKKIASAEQKGVSRTALSPDGKHAISGGGTESGVILWGLP